MRTRVMLACLVVGPVSGVASAGLCLVALSSWRRVLQAGPASLDEACTAVTSTAAVLLVAGWALGLACAVLSHLPGRVGRWSDRAAGVLATRTTRRLAGVLLGASVLGAVAPVAAVAGPGGSTGGPGFGITRFAAAEPPGPGFAATTAGPGSEAGTQRPGWTPTRPVVRRQPVTALVTRGSARHRADEVVVLGGDTLWQIAATHLGPGASDAEVARAWPAWHEANRDVIGTDPDVLRPGQVLRAPQAAGR